MKALKDCQNMFGESIKPEYQKRIKKFLDDPNFDTWDDIKGIIISPNMDSIWNVVIKFDSTFPKSGRVENEKGKVIKEWERIPTPLQVLQAIKAYNKL